MLPRAPAAGHNSQHLFARLGKIEYRATGSLKPYSNNPRKHSRKQFAKLAASIREFASVLVDQADVIVCALPQSYLHVATAYTIMRV